MMKGIFSVLILKAIKSNNIISPLNTAPSGRVIFRRKTKAEKENIVEAFFVSIDLINISVLFMINTVQTPVSINDKIVQLTKTGFAKIKIKASIPSSEMILLLSKWLSMKLIKLKTVKEISKTLNAINNISGFFVTKYPVEQIRTHKGELKPSTLSPPC